MDQHPVPQHIASFEFKLFGNLTVRQFVTLAIPMSAAAAIFFSGLPTLIRFPLAALLAIFAFIAALVPIGGRPLHKWVIAFIRAILSPTQRIWIKELQIPQFLSMILAPPPAEVPANETITAGGREKLRQYLRSLPKRPLAPLDVAEQLAVQRLGLDGLPFRVNLLGEPSEALAKEGNLLPPIIWLASPAGGPQASLPQITPHAKPYVLPGLEKKLTKTTGGPKAKLASEANFAVENIIPIKTPDKQIRLIHGVGKTRVRKLHFAPPEGFNLARLPIRGEKRFEISEELKRRFQFDESLFEKQFTEINKLPTTNLGSTQPASTRVERGKQSPKDKKAVPKPKLTTETPQGVSAKTASSPSFAATISQSWPKSTKLIPAKDLAMAQIVPLTNRPNVISGITTTTNGTPLPNVILVVKDANGIPKRAFKTNKLGQFLSATSLENGTYTVEVESELHTFEPFTVSLTGQVLAPIEIRAKT